jgi:hypothetical protein
MISSRQIDEYVGRMAYRTILKNTNRTTRAVEDLTLIGCISGREWTLPYKLNDARRTWKERAPQYRSTLFEFDSIGTHWLGSAHNLGNDEALVGVVGFRAGRLGISGTIHPSYVVQHLNIPGEMVTTSEVLADCLNFIFGLDLCSDFKEEANERKMLDPGLG